LAEEFLEIHGARVHNLKGVNLRLPHNKLIVVTGVSGSGKSSLVFDTIYAEGQRRYVESLSAYARQFLERIEKPDVDEIRGIAPAVAIRQKNTTRNPRSTVATATEIYDFLRLLFARAGRTHCDNCGRLVRKDTIDHVASEVLKLPERSRWYVLFPVRAQAPEAEAERAPQPRRKGRKKKGAGKKKAARAQPSDPMKARLSELRAKGFNRLYQHGRVFEFSTPESLLELDFSGPFYALVDRIAIGPDIRSRVVDAVEIAYREAQEAVFEQAGEHAPGRLWFSERFECRQCGRAFPEPEPRLFSFNSPFGACPTCQGFGNTVDINLDAVIPDRFKTLREGAIEPWTKSRYLDYQEWMLSAARKARVPVDKPFRELTREQVQWVLSGGDEFPGVYGFFEYLETKKYKMHVRIFIARYRGYTLCPECRGARLRKEAFNVRLGGKNIGEVAAMSLEEAKAFFDGLKLEGEFAVIAGQVLEDIRHRLTFLNEVGLEYLTLDRQAATLSGGEAQRIQLASSLGSRLVGACYVLDEPSIGLHRRDTGRLIRILQHLRDLGNTIVVVEHDREIIEAADYLIDLGPGAGERGGEVMFAGEFDKILSNGAGRSLTAHYLKGDYSVPAPRRRRTFKARNKMRFEGAVARNLKNIDVELPLGVMTVVTGVSGSGKSTLVHDVIYNGWRRAAHRGQTEGESSESGPQAYRRVTGATKIDEAVLVDQSPIGRSPRSNPVTYVKAFDGVRELFASTEDAKRRGFIPSHFSFNVPGGRCETCQGAGVVTVEMQFLADIELVCEDCNGTRFQSSTLEASYQGKNIHEVLNMTVDEALRFFIRTPKIVDRLAPLSETGLGYLRLGQSATTLSGGEAQRVKLASHVGHARCDNTLFIFDEPTTGLHFDDIAKLLVAFRKLIGNGGTILVIEHNLDIIKNADWIIDLGPEGGGRGGEIVVAGRPEEVAACERSYTGRYLAGVLDERVDAV